MVLNSLVLYFPQDLTTEGIVQYFGLLCYLVLDLHRDIDSKLRYEEYQVPYGAWYNGSLYKEYDGINKRVG